MHARRIPVLAAVALVALSALGSAQAAEKRQTVTVYAVPTTAQFMNHADDRLRGMATNPFNVKTEALVIVTKGKEKENGPFPGDDVLYSFKLYGGPKLAKHVGRAMFTCYYTFAKHATCDSYFDLAQGVILASGQVPFGQPHFTLGVTGGTKAYFGALGDVRSSAAGGNAERFVLRMTGLPK